MTRKIVILGAGCAGTMVANKLRQALKQDEWSITVIDRDADHIYQPGLLFVPFGIYQANHVRRPKSQFLGAGIELVIDGIRRIDHENQRVETAKGSFAYDKLVVSTGVELAPEEIDGMMEGWQKDIFDFYTLPGAENLAKALRDFDGGKIVLDVAEVPFKCPVAPMEFVYLADWYFTQRGMRDKVQIQLVTPLLTCLNFPIAGAYLGDLARAKNIDLSFGFSLESVDCRNRTIRSFKGDTIDFDLLVSIPPNVGSEALIDSGVADASGLVSTDKHTLKAMNFDNMWVIGDTADLPTSKAGSVAHFSAEVMVENFIREIKDEPLKPEYDGHSNCFIETGFGNASLIDFNYSVEPLPGRFPVPGFGPFTLVGESRVNHWGKMMFRWVYWNLLLPGKKLPIPPQMSMAGKVRDS